jgi:hypothetical protein
LTIVANHQSSQGRTAPRRQRSRGGADRFERVDVLRERLREISIASHFMSKGWDVEFMDYSGAARFDLLARRRMIAIEVECKSTSGDTGRKIHRQGSSSPCRLAGPRGLPISRAVI